MTRFAIITIGAALVGVGNLTGQQLLVALGFIVIMFGGFIAAVDAISANAKRRNKRPDGDA